MKKIYKDISKEDLYKDYIENNMRRAEIAKKYNVPEFFIKNCLRKYQIHKSRSALTKLRNETVNAQNTLENSLKRVSKEELIKYFINENHSRTECCEHFNVTMNNLKKIISIYEIPHKDRQLVNKAINESLLEKYGVLYGFELANKGNNKDTKPNLEFKKLLEDNNISFEREFRLEHFIYDFKVGNILIEINPTITHNSTISIFGDEPLDKFYHRDKTNLALAHGYRCIHVWDWDDLDKITYLLRPMSKIYARKCTIKSVLKDEAKEFINKYHLQGYAKDSIRLGLYYDNQLVSIMTFDKPRYNKNYEYELVRYCSCMNVIGGKEKLFKYFNDRYNPWSIISYCDLSKFSGKSYSELGFKENKKSVASCHWYNIKTKQHITDNLLRQRGYDQLFGTDYGKGSSNEELMLNAGFLQVYDCGQKVFSYM